MAKHRIRITGLPGKESLGSGLHGAPTADNPTGEYPIGFEFDTDADMPVGWVGRAAYVGEGPAEGAVFVGNDDDARIEGIRKEVIAEAQKHIDGIKAEHADALEVETDRALAAEKQVTELTARIAQLEKDAADRGPDPELIRAAVEGLDPKNEAHWTKAGLPEVAAVKEALGADVTRAQIEAAAPDAKRPTE